MVAWFIPVIASVATAAIQANATPGTAPQTGAGGASGTNYSESRLPEVKELSKESAANTDERVNTKFSDDMFGGRSAAISNRDFMSTYKYKADLGRVGQFPIYDELNKSPGERVMQQIQANGTPVQAKDAPATPNNGSNKAAYVQMGMQLAQAVFAAQSQQGVAPVTGAGSAMPASTPAALEGYKLQLLSGDSDKIQRYNAPYERKRVQMEGGNQYGY